MPARKNRLLIYLLSLPERLLRFLAASLGGLIFELTELLLPRAMRRTRIYQALVYRLLRITVELVGDVRYNQSQESIEAGELIKRKTVGNVIELLSFAAVGWSPLWLLAAASDISGGTRAYLQAFVAEMQKDGLLQTNQNIQSVDDLLTSLQKSTQVAADLVDIPPLNVQDLQESWQNLKNSAVSLPDASQLSQTYQALIEVSRREGRSIGEISALLAGGAVKAGVQLGNTYLFTYYQNEFNAIQREGWGAYALRVARPYLQASKRHLDPNQSTHIEKLIQRYKRHKSL